MIPAVMHTLFISDLHLSQERPDKLELFRQLLRGKARQAKALYILGDLFEAWAGDDDNTPPHQAIISELAEFSRSGTPLYVMRGNRDFLIGRDFARKTGGEMIEDPTAIMLYGQKTLLMHGDTLCTSDTSYQLYRKLTNNRLSIALFKCLPFFIRKRLWHGVRHLTRKSSQQKPPEIVDVQQSAVVSVMREYGVRTLIHGHTHREGVHPFKIDGAIATRYVLGDWYEKDSILVADKNEPRLLRVEAYLDENV